MKDDTERNERLKVSLAMLGIALVILAILKLLS
jgi:hypothetical protein